MFKTFDGSKESLTDHCLELTRQHQVSVTKQSMDAKFNAEGVSFIKELIDYQLAQQLSLSKVKIHGFDRVLIQDSTRFGLPKSFQSDYRGYSRAKMPSGAQLQFAYDLNQHTVCQIDICDAVTPDRKFAFSNDWITPGALVVRDLGYFLHKGLEEITQKSAFFLTRAFPRTAFFNPENPSERIDLELLTKRMKRYNIPVIELPVLFGIEEKRYSRAIIEIVPDQVKEERMRTIRIKRKNVKGGGSKEYALWAGINVFLTNTTSEQLTTDQIIRTYRCRWQVELVFKTWKSFLELHKYKTYKSDRLNCYLLASLLLVLIHWRVFSALQEFIFFTRRKVLSIHKFTKVLIHLKGLIRNVVRSKKGACQELFNILINLSEKYIYKERKKGKISFVEAVDLQYYAIFNISEQESPTSLKQTNHRTL